MKQIAKRLLAWTLVLALVVGFATYIAPATVTVEAAGKMSLSQLRAKFPHNKYWNHANNPGASSAVNNQDGWTNTPCTNHDTGAIGTSRQTCNGFEIGGYQYSWQCMGYAEKLGYDFTGYSPRVNANGWYTNYSASALDTLKPGDIVRCNNGGHSIFITGVSGDTITYTHCNVGGTCIIKWDATITKARLLTHYTYTRVAPYAIDEASGPAMPSSLHDLGYSFTATITDSHSGKNLEYKNNGEYNDVVINPASSSNTQKWQFTRQGDGSYEIKNVANGENLAVLHGSGDQGKGIVTWGDNDAASQRWFLYSVGNGYIMRPGTSSTNVIEVGGGSINDGTKLLLWGYSGSPAQIYKIMPCEVMNFGDNFIASINGAHAGKNLEPNNNGEYFDVVINPVANKDAQKWNFIRQSNGSYKIKNVATGECLAPLHGTAVEGKNVITWGDNGETNQRWFICSAGAGYILRNAASSDYVLEVSGGVVTDGAKNLLWKFTGSPAQLWNIVPSNVADLGTGFTATITGVHSGKNLEPNNNGEFYDVVINPAADKDAQKWVFTRQSDGSYEIKNKWSGECIDILYGSAASGATLNTWSDTNGATQRWYICEVNGAYVLRSAVNNPYVVEVGGGSSATGTKLLLWSFTNSPAQRFTINKVSGSSSTTPSTTPSSSTTKSTTSTTKSTTKSTTSTTKSTTSTTKSTTKSTTSTTKSTTKSTTSTTKSTTKSTTSTTKSTTKPTSSTKPTTPTVPGNAISLGDSFTAVIGNGNKNAAVSGTNVAMANKAVNLAQYWKFTRQANGSYEIVSVASGKALDVASASNKAGANVQIWKDNNSVAQRWYIYEANGGYVLRTAVGDTVLAVKSGNVEMATYSGASAQVFTIAKTTPANIGTNFVASINNVKSGKNVAGSGSNVLIDTARIANAQYWRFTRQTDGSYEIKNIYTGKCLDVASSSAARGANVQVWRDNNSVAQRWFIYEVNGKYVLSPNCTLSCVLDVAGGKTAAGTNVQTWTYNASVAQQFTIDKTAFANVGTNFTATIQSVKAKKNVAVSGSNVQLANASTANAQKWTFVRQSDGSYEIKNVATGKCLDVSSCDTARGANVQVWRDNNSVAQRWYIYAVDGGYVLSSACCPNTVMDIAGGKTAAGTNVQTWTGNNTVAQVFTINK